MRTLAIAVAVVLVFIPVASATEYFVAVNGNDANSGTSTGAAWKTLQHAADKVIAGDGVTVLPGNYKGFNLFTSGTAVKPITFRAQNGSFAPDPNVVIDQNNSFTNKDRINLEGASYVVVQGFTVIGTGDGVTNRACIRAVTAAFVTIRNNRCDLGGHWGIFTGFVDDLLIENNITSHSAVEHGIYVSNSGDRPVIRRNVSFDNFANGIHMNGDLSQGGDGTISDAIVEQNIIHGNGVGGGSGINCDGVTNSIIRNNLLYDNHASGISLYRIDGATGSKNNVIVNNTIHEAADARWCLNIQNASTGNHVRNNILFNDNPGHGSIDISTNSLTGLISNYNVVKDLFSNGGSFVSFAQWKSQTGQDANSTVSTPAATLIAVASGNYDLLPNSPALDTGVSTQAPTVDLKNKPRPFGAGFDRGAYEHGSCIGSFQHVGAPLLGTAGAAPTIAVTGCPDLGDTFSLTLTPSLPGAAGILFFGTQTAHLPFLGGAIELVPIATLPFNGTVFLSAPIPADPALNGLPIRFQIAVVDAGALFGVALSDALVAALAS